MKRWGVAVVVLVSIASLTIVAVVVNRPSHHVDQFSCPIGHDLEARTCAEAEQHCLGVQRFSRTAADGPRLSYGYTCEHGVMTAFSFSG
jgi:hypothetical protein